MVKLEALMPYPIDGETTKYVQPGQTAIWKFTTWKHPDAPERKAKLMCVVSNHPYYDDNWPDPERDFKSPPTFILDGEEFPPFVVQLNVWPKECED